MSGDVVEEYEALIQFLYLAPVGLVQATLDGAIVMANPISAQLLMPLSRDGALDNLFTVLENVAPELRLLTAEFAAPHGMVCDALRIPLAGNGSGDARADPKTLSLSLLKLDDARLMAVLGDVTQAVRRERLLKQNQAWFNAILTGIADYALVGLDAQGRVDDWNPSIARVTGFTREAVQGQPYSIFYPAGATTEERLLDRLREADRDGWSLDDGWRRKADGTRFWGSAIIAPLNARDDGAVDPDGAADERGYSLILRDITDRRDAGESLRRAISCDHLTGLANRRAFFEAAEIEIDRWRRLPRPLSLILFDADHFKRVNDRHGHPGGDAVLRGLAERLTGTFREVDVVARIGGEEFVVLLPSTDLHGARAVADRLRQSVEAHCVDFDGRPIGCTVSAGVAAMDDGVADLAALMKRADQALYAAKAAGRNRVECWSPAAALPSAAEAAESIA